ncbi:lamin tail domain-containing protein, partial [Verrucomicrobia bacterium]|nr:lamin tail domain-containing protein [Verrucomicrobiota bacterium]
MSIPILRPLFFWLLDSGDSLLQVRAIRNMECLLLSVFLFTVGLTAQPLVLSEFMASNQSGMIDEDGDRSDWIEIYNTGTEPASLNGWYLSDDASDLTKWRFPDQFIPMQSSLIVFASGKDRKGVGAELHTNFKLSSKGGFLGLIQPDTRTIAHAYDPTYPTQFPDISYGITMRNERTVLVSHDAVGNIHFPKNNSMAQAWTMPDFDDSQWREAYFGIGYQQGVEENNSDPQNPMEEPLELGDVTRASDPIDPSSQFSPVGEMVDAAIDNNTATKYLNFDKLNTGFTVKLSLGPTAVSGLRLTSANDAPDRDPSQFILSGSSDGINFVEIAKGAIPVFENRFETIQIDFQNTLKHAYYRLVFPTVRNERVAVAMQIAEVELLGWLPESSVSDPGETSTPVLIDVTMLEDISMPDDDIDPSSSNSPFGEEVWRAIDNNPQTKYLNFDGTGSGFTLKPGHGLTVVNGLRLTSANDVESRDPTAYLLEGSSGGGVFELIAQGPLPLFEERFSTVEVAFANDLPFDIYRLVFPSLRASTGQIMQIAEVEFLGKIGLPPPAFVDLIQTDIETSMYAQHASAYARLPFFAGEEVDFEGLSLNVRFDDGFIAYINGVEVARANAPNKLGFDSVAESDRGTEVAAIVKHFDLRSFESLIEPGKNLLAIHALNDNVHSSEFLLEAQLENGAMRTVLSDVGYFEIPSPGLLNTDVKSGSVPAPIIHVESGFMKDAFDLEILPGLEGVRIYYTTDGSNPDMLSGHPYTGPLKVEKTTVLRAVGLRDGWIPSPVLTRTYLFTSDIV